jgi:hypothetical protein
MPLRPPGSFAGPEISFCPWREKHFAIIDIAMGKSKRLPNKKRMFRHTSKSYNLFHLTVLLIV